MGKETEKRVTGLVGDFLGDEFVQKLPEMAMKAEKLRRVAQMGTVPGAGVALANVGKIAPFMRMGSTPMAGAVLEIGKGVKKVMDHPDIGEEAAAGRELLKEPMWYQAGNLVINTSEATSQYGAVAQEEGKKRFEDEHRLPEGLSARVEELNKEAGNRQSGFKKMWEMMSEAHQEELLKRQDENRKAEIEKMKRALDPEYNLEGRTMDMVSEIVRGGGKI